MTKKKHFSQLDKLFLDIPPLSWQLWDLYNQGEVYVNVAADLSYIKLYVSQAASCLFWNQDNSDWTHSYYEPAPHLSFKLEYGPYPSICLMSVPRTKRAHVFLCPKPSTLRTQSPVIQECQFCGCSPKETEEGK